MNDELGSCPKIYGTPLHHQHLSPKRENWQNPQKAINIHRLLMKFSFGLHYQNEMRDTFGQTW